MNIMFSALNTAKNTGFKTALTPHGVSRQVSRAGQAMLSNVRFGTDSFSSDIQQKQTEQALRNAIRNLDDTAVLALLEKPGMTAILNETTPDAEGSAPFILEATVLLGNRPQAGLNIVKALLARGANPFANDRKNRNAFLMACVRVNRAEDEYLPLIQLFLDYARQNQPTKDPDLYSQGLNWLVRQGQGRTPENQQRLLTVAEELLNNGANPNFLVSLNQFDTLQLASMGLGEKSPKRFVRGPRDWPEMIRLLLTPRNDGPQPGDPVNVSRGKISPVNISHVTLAGAYGHTESLQALLNVLPEQERPWAMQKALYYGILNQSQGTLDMLLPAIAQMPIATGNSDNISCNLLLACLRSGNFKLFERILKDNPALLPVALQSNLLHGLAKGVYPPRDLKNGSDLEEIRISGYDSDDDIMGLNTIPAQEQLEKLLDWLDETLPASISLKSVLNQPDQHQYTPLMYAAERGNLCTMRQLIDAGADPVVSNEAFIEKLNHEKLNLPPRVHQTVMTMLSTTRRVQDP
jgi:hypothetical protein